MAKGGCDEKHCKADKTSCDWPCICHIAGLQCLRHSPGECIGLPCSGGKKCPGQCICNDATWRCEAMPNELT